MTTNQGIALPNIKDLSPEAETGHSKLGLGIAAVGFGVVMATAVANWASISSVGIDSATVGETTLWAGGFGILGLGTIKVAVAVVLVGIIMRLWIRVDGLKTAVPKLEVRPGATSVYSTNKGVVISEGLPKSLPIHRMASRMWKPMLAMGAMGVAGGAIIRLIAANSGAGTESFRETAAWGIGLEFLGETMLLASISFLLATILASLRHGGAEVQEAAAGAIKVLKMPATGKAFIVVMMLGTMVGVGQFVASIVLAGLAGTPGDYGPLAAFLGPLREFGLGTMLTGIVLALVTIGNVIRFQFDRIRELARMGERSTTPVPA